MYWPRFYRDPNGDFVIGPSDPQPNPATHSSSSYSSRSTSPRAPDPSTGKSIVRRSRSLRDPRPGAPPPPLVVQPAQPAVEIRRGDPPPPLYARGLPQPQPSLIGGRRSGGLPPPIWRDVPAPAYNDLPSPRFMDVPRPERSPSTASSFTSQTSRRSEQSNNEQSLRSTSAPGTARQPLSSLSANHGQRRARPVSRAGSETPSSPGENGPRKRPKAIEQHAAKETDTLSDIIGAQRSPGFRGEQIQELEENGIRLSARR